MKYDSGEKVLLGDTVRFDSGPDQFVTAKVVMLGEDYSHLDVGPGFLAWVVSDRVLEETGVVVEVDSNPGNYMFTTLCCVKLIQRMSA